MSRGRKTIAPTTAAAIAAQSTAPAAMSFARPASGCSPGETRSVSASIAVFKPSAVQTSPIAPTTAHHSQRRVPGQIPAPPRPPWPPRGCAHSPACAASSPRRERRSRKLRTSRPRVGGFAGRSSAMRGAGYFFSGKNFGASPGFASSRLGFSLSALLGGRGLPCAPARRLGARAAPPRVRRPGASRRHWRAARARRSRRMENHFIRAPEASGARGRCAAKSCAVTAPR